MLLSLDIKNHWLADWFPFNKSHGCCQNSICGQIYICTPSSWITYRLLSLDMKTTFWVSGFHSTKSMVVAEIACLVKFLHEHLFQE